MSGHWNAPHPLGSPGTIIPLRWHLLRPFWQQLFDLCCCVQLFSHLRYKVSLASKDHILLFLASWKLHSAISHTTLGAWGAQIFSNPLDILCRYSTLLLTEQFMWTSQWVSLAIISIQICLGVLLFLYTPRLEGRVGSMALLRDTCQCLTVLNLFCFSSYLSQICKFLYPLRQEKFSYIIIILLNLFFMA